MRRRRLILSTLLAFALAASPAAAQDPPGSGRGSAEEALEQTERLLDGRGVDTKRELSAALAELATQTDELGTGDRKAARTILKRPTDAGDDDEYTAPDEDLEVSCSTNFCFHWVTSTEDMPNLTDGADANTRPDYIDLLEASFERSFQVEVGELGWLPPLNDDGRGGDDRIDVYVANIGDFAFGYAAPEGAANSRSNTAYLVLDNDYSVDEFRKYGGDPTIPVQATAAHEYNHALQYRYDSFQDDWMFESTATWSEERVFDAANDYVSYLRPWARLPGQALTSDGTGSTAEDANLKMYGSAIWNHWLASRYDPAVVRQAWAVSQANSVQGGGFAPGAYDRAIRDLGGPGFAAEFQEFAASAAEWDASNSGIREGATFPEEVARNGSLLFNGPAVTGTVDHTAFALYDVPPADVGQFVLNGVLPPGTAGSIALVGFAGGTATNALTSFDGDGRVSATLPDPGRFERITAVVTNADTSHAGYSLATRDWAWTRDAQPFTLSLTETPAGGGTDGGTGGGGTGTGGTDTGTGTGGGTGGGDTSGGTGGGGTTVDPPPGAGSLSLSRGTLPRLRTIARRGVVPFLARVNKAGRLTATATVDRRAARRLRVGRRTTKVGSGRRSPSDAGRVKVNVRLTKKARRALKRQRRVLRMKVRVRFVPADGGSAITRTITLRLRR